MTVIKGFDTYGTPNAATLVRAKSLGFEVICQYYGTPTSAKLLTPVEAQRITDAGLLIFSVFEKSTTRPLQGRAAGLEDAALALAQARAVEQPLRSTIAFAVDSDPDMNDLQVKQAIVGYFGAIQETLSNNYRLGGYGGGDVLDMLLNANLISVAWLGGAMGWRGSRDFLKTDRWHIRQYLPLKTSDPNNKLGVEYDPDDIRSLEAIGPWSLRGEVPAQPSSVTSIPAPGGTIGSLTGPIDIFDLQTKLAVPPQRYYKGAIDGWAGDLTAAALVAYSKEHRPSPKK